MILKKESKGAKKQACPHTRGDDPNCKLYGAELVQLVPTRVGMIPSTNGLLAAWDTCPHTRGDDPSVVFVGKPCKALSPHAWG